MQTFNILKLFKRTKSEPQTALRFWDFPSRPSIVPAMRVVITPQGEISPWVFSTGFSCGKAIDSIGIETEKTGCVFTREDVSKLRKFFEEVEARWNPQSTSAQ